MSYFVSKSIHMLKLMVRSPKKTFTESTVLVSYEINSTSQIQISISQFLLIFPTRSQREILKRCKLDKTFMETY